MSDKIITHATSEASASPSITATFDRAAGARMLARTFYKECRASGYSPRQLLAVSTELIDLITQDLQRERQSPTDVHGAA